MALGHPLWDQKELIDEKTGYKKTCETLPVRYCMVIQKVDHL